MQAVYYTPAARFELGCPGCGSPISVPDAWAYDGRRFTCGGCGSVPALAVIVGGADEGGDEVADFIALRRYQEELEESEEWDCVLDDVA
jgi:hypothetical protein